MTTDRWEQVQKLFEEALKRKPEERAAFLDEACGGDAELRREVESLLAHHDEATTDFLQPPGPQGTVSARPRTQPIDPLIGCQVGHYKILEVLGEGGMGTVYLAEQTEPVKRRVALKIIKLGIDTKQVIARFEAERQALAMMDHPHVAKVLDAGITDPASGSRPYFVMEYIPGVPITEHCDRQRLSIEQRLQLFMSVCDAVQHAHQKGIIHRDIKPSNILVSVKNGQGEPKVIDFGVAKALHQKLTEKTLFTEHGQLIGTPEYMSPEQAEMTQQDIDTRSDIYSLGVLLYELLTGALPFDPRKLRSAGFGEIQRIIREEEPPRPSTRLSSLGEASTTSAQNRQLDSRSLERQLRGDLDWIVMKSLEKDRTRRYETANGLAMDIQRHLSHEPVVAGRSSAVYRLRKFIKRHRAATAVIFTSVVALAVVVGGLVIGLRSRAAAELARQEARELEMAAVLADFRQRSWSDLSDDRRDQVSRIVNLLAERVLNGTATPHDCFELAQAMVDVELAGRWLQQTGVPSIRLALGRRKGPRAEGIAARLRSRMELNHNPADWGESQPLLLDLGEPGYITRYVVLKNELPEKGQYRLIGEIEVQLVRVPPGFRTFYDIPDGYGQILSPPMVLPVPELKFTVVGELPDDYPPLVIDNDLATRFVNAIEFRPCTFLPGYQGVCVNTEVILPMPPMDVAFEVTFEAQAEGERWVSTDFWSIKKGHLSPAGSGGGGGWRDANASDASFSVFPSVCLPMSAVPDLANPSDSISFALTIQASHTAAIAAPEINAYLDFSIHRELTVEPSEQGWFLKREELYVQAYRRGIAEYGQSSPMVTVWVHDLVQLYTAWHEVEPDQGYDAKAAEWRAKLPEEVNDKVKSDG